MLANKAARQAEACEDRVDKRCTKKAPQATLSPSPSKRDRRWKRWRSGSCEVLTGGQDDCRQRRSKKQEGKKPHGNCPFHRTDAHYLVDCYVIKGFLEKDRKHRRDHDDKDKDDGAVGLGFQQTEQTVAFIHGGSSSYTSHQLYKLSREARMRVKSNTAGMIKDLLC
ncbi:hypothetical protein E2562_002105 [Oryza meyeriana var. granulata]|uniref:Uncharacterized protein n=1 Tax=Oryza meyeriana var. granulata TaxID=110450 RepID=A0A6G1ECL3_9ORYZ|nr:hypothetical protein E2562_002105 [Oryza meyeriana var. granulata]